MKKKKLKKTNTAMKRFIRHLPVILFVTYLVVLAGITILRPWNRSYQFMGGSINPRVLVEYIPIFRASLFRFMYLFAGNIVWFMPFGFYLIYYGKRSMAQAVLYGFFLSLFIEVMQFVLGTGISEMDDLILNTTGCLLGGGAAKIAHTIRKR